MDGVTVVSPPAWTERAKEEARWLRRSINALHRKWGFVLYWFWWWRVYQIRAAVLGFEIRHHLPVGGRK